MRLFWIVMLAPFVTLMPSPLLPEMTQDCQVSGPPMRMLLAEWIKMPSRPLPRSTVPPGSTPTLQAKIWMFSKGLLKVGSLMAMPSRVARLMDSARRVTSLLAMVRTSVFAPWDAPLISTANSGCDQPSMSSGSVMAGSGVVGVMVGTMPPGMAKAMRSSSGAALASRIACRNEPAPESFELMTVSVGARTLETTLPALFAASGSASFALRVTLVVKSPVEVGAASTKTVVSVSGARSASVTVIV